MDRLSLFGIAAGFIALFGTQFIEGGDPTLLFQGSAAAIVFFGTIGATSLSCGASEFRDARDATIQVFRASRQTAAILPAFFCNLAFIARKDGIVALEKVDTAQVSPFTRRALAELIDGCDEEQLLDLLESDYETRHRRMLAAAMVFETAGGYAPTMGILGAVLGLTRAMESLDDPSALGSGIAVAFVATIYGVALANLILLPFAAKLRSRIRAREVEDRMTIEGTLGLLGGIAPRMIERRLAAHLSVGNER